MAVYGEGRGIAGEAQPFGLVAEGAAAIAAVVLAIIAPKGVSAAMLASITTIIIGFIAIVMRFFTAATA